MKQMNVFESLNATYPTNNMLRNGLSRAVHKTTIRLLPGPTSNHVADTSLVMKKQRKAESVFTIIRKLAKRKLSLLGAEKVFRRVFNVIEGEELIKASKCCLFTTAGPISGRLFISSHKIAFCSSEPITKFDSPTAKSLSFHYKVVIPLRKIRNQPTRQCQKQVTEVPTSDHNR